MSANTSITAGGTQQFSALAIDQHGLAMSGIAFTWASSDPSVASVDTNGLATGIATGTVQITASAQSAVSNAVSLTVTAAPCNCPIAITRALAADGVGGERRSGSSHDYGQPGL